MRWSRALGALGRVLVTAGVLVLGFVAQQLWGTGLHEARAQHDLRREFAAHLDEPGPAPPGTTSSTVPTSTTSVADGPAPTTGVALREGDAAARLVIPRIGVDKIVVEGVDLSDLRRGPGHYPNTPLPGQAGNAAVAGHRTTYGAPFNRIDELEPGDEIVAETPQGRFRYLVRTQRIVDPSEVSVLAPTGRNELTLTACHPKYSARQRIVVVAELAAGQTPAPTPVVRPGSAPRAEAPTALDESDARPARAGAWALACVAVAAAAWWGGRRWRRLPSYLVALLPLAFGLFWFYDEIGRLLPGNY